MIYVPQGWAYIVSTRGSKPTVTLAEARLEPGQFLWIFCPILGEKP